jgi:drug/metabolite transporter (DMT)-like permease
MSKDKVGVVCAVICEVLFGFSFLFSKRIMSSVMPVTLLSWRFIFAFLLINICVLTRVVKVDLRKKPLMPLLVIALFQPVLYFAAESLGIKLTTASESGTFIACIPILTVVFSALILKEYPRKLQLAGVLVTVAGILLIVLVKGLNATLNPLGYLMLLIAVVSGSLYSIFARKAEAYTSAEITYVMMGMGAIVFTAAALIRNASAGTLGVYATVPFKNPDFLIAVLYLSVGCSVVAFLLFNTALAAIGANRAASFVGLSTVVTVTAGIIILREPYSLVQGLGTALVIGGVTMANLPRASLSSRNLPKANLPSPSLPSRDLPAANLPSKGLEISKSE